MTEHWVDRLADKILQLQAEIGSLRQQVAQLQDTVGTLKSSGYLSQGPVVQSYIVKAAQGLDVV